jgi:hypothetical protein
VISLSILVVTVIGLSAAVWKMKVYECIFVKKNPWRERISPRAPSEGGYSRSVWGHFMIVCP